MYRDVWSCKDFSTAGLIDGQPFDVLFGNLEIYLSQIPLAHSSSMLHALATHFKHLYCLKAHKSQDSLLLNTYSSLTTAAALLSSTVAYGTLNI